MGIDLTINIVRMNKKRWWLLYDRLSFNRNYELFGYFGDVGGYSETKKVIITHKIPEGIQVTLYTDDGCKDDKKNPYGKEMIWCYAEEFKKIPINKCDTTHFNKEVIRFIKRLEPKDIIVLEWR